MEHIERIEVTFNEGLDQYDSLQKIEEGLKNIYGERNKTIRTFLGSIEKLTRKCVLSRYNVLINDNPIDIATLETYDLIEAIKCFEDGKCQVTNESPEHMIISYPNPEIQESEEVERYLKVVKNYASAALESGNPEFYYHSIPVLKHILFERVPDDSEGHFRFRDALCPYLRFLNLSKFFLNDVDISNTDLSYTNLPCIYLSTVYNSAAIGTNLTGVHLANYIVHSANLRNSTLVGTYACINIETTKLDGATIDETVTLYDKNHRCIQKGKKAGKVPTLRKL